MNTCVCCGAVIPEGGMVCRKCWKNNGFPKINFKKDLTKRKVCDII